MTDRPQFTPKGPVINGAQHSWKDGALQIEPMLWCHNETHTYRDTATAKGPSFFIVRRFGRKGIGAVGEGGKSAQSAWRAAYHALAMTPSATVRED
jgi:hypothetical protein